MAKKQHKNVRLSEVQDSLDEEKEINAGEPDDEMIDHDDFTETDRIDVQREAMEYQNRNIPFDFEIYHPQTGRHISESILEHNQRIVDDEYRGEDDFNDDDRIENYAPMLSAHDPYVPPQPPSWESIFDTANRSQNGQTLGDLLKDMNAIEQPSRFVQEILTLDTSDLKDKATVVAYQKQRDPEKDLHSYRCAAMDEAIKEAVMDSLEEGLELQIRFDKQITVEPESFSSAPSTSLGALLRTKFTAIEKEKASLDPITMREQSIRKQELVADVLSTAYPSNCSRITDAKKDKF